MSCMSSIAMIVSILRFCLLCGGISAFSFVHLRTAQTCAKLPTSYVSNKLSLIVDLSPYSVRYCNSKLDAKNGSSSNSDCDDVNGTGTNLSRRRERIRSILLHSVSKASQKVLNLKKKEKYSLVFQGGAPIKDVLVDAAANYVYNAIGSLDNVAREKSLSGQESDTTSVRCEDEVSRVEVNLDSYDQNSIQQRQRLNFISRWRNIITATKLRVVKAIDDADSALTYTTNDIQQNVRMELVNAKKQAMQDLEELEMMIMNDKSVHTLLGGTDESYDEKKSLSDVVGDEDSFIDLEENLAVHLGVKIYDDDVTIESAATSRNNSILETQTTQNDDKEPIRSSLLFDISSLRYEDVDFSLTDMAPPFINEDECLVPGEPIVMVEKAPQNSRRIFAGIDIPHSVDEVWSLLTDYENLQTVVPNLVVNQVLEFLPGSNDTFIPASELHGLNTKLSDAELCRSMANRMKGVVLKQVGGAKVVGINFSARTTLEVREWPEGLPDFAHFEEEVYEGKTRSMRVKESKDRALTRYVFPRPFALSSLPHKDISMQSVENDDGEFRMYQGVWRMQPLPGCAPPGLSAMRLTYAVEVSPRPYLPVSFVEGRIAEDLCLNLKAIREKLAEH